MRILIGPQQIDLVALDPVLDKSVIDIYRSFLAGIPADYNAFTSAVGAYLQSPTANHEGYVKNFVWLWQQFFSRRQFEAAERIWEVALDPVLSWESANPQNHLHKGTPYYFWAMTAFEAGKLDAGFALMHQALKEDQSASPSKFRDKPAFLFASLNFEEAGQAYRARVKGYADYVDRVLDDYRRTHQRSLTMSDIRSRFLSAPPDVETVFLFTYVVARLLEIEKIPDHARQSVFAGQMEANVLFDLALIIDTAIHAKNPAKWKPIDHAAYLATHAGVSLTKDDLKGVNGDFLSDFDQTLNALLSLSYTVSAGQIDPLAGRIAVAYGMRNRGAHNVLASDTFFQRFETVRNWMLECFFLTVDTLY